MHRERGTAVRYGLRFALVVSRATAAAVVALTASAPLGAQALSSRPASVALTAFVPSLPATQLPGLETPVVVRRTVNEIELAIPLGAGLHATRASRLEVSLPADAAPARLRLGVRNSVGAFEPLVPGAGPVTVMDAIEERVVADDLTIRFESAEPIASPLPVLPLHVRLRFGTGESATSWRYVSPLRLEPARAEVPGAMTR